MFDLTSGKLLLLGIVALIVLGPKDFPILLRTIGKYMGMIRRQADEFRDQFNEAIRESEFDQIKKDVEGLGKDLDTTMRDTQESVTKELGSVTQEFESVRHDIDAQLNDPLKPSPHTDTYTPLGVEDHTEPAATGPATAEATVTSDIHDASAVPAAAPPASPTERASMNGSSRLAEPAGATEEPAAKSGT